MGAVISLLKKLRSASGSLRAVNKGFKIQLLQLSVRGDDENFIGNRVDPSSAALLSSDT